MSTTDSPTFDPSGSQDTQGSNPPEWKRRLGHLSISVFARKGNADSDAPFRTAVFQRSFRDRSGEWQQTSVSLTLTEISNSIRLLELARQHMEIVSESA